MSAILPRQPVKNPWGLTMTQVDAIDALNEKGTVPLAADRLRINRKSLARTIRRCLSKMPVGQGPGSAHRMGVMWAAWRATDGKDVPA